MTEPLAPAIHIASLALTLPAGFERRAARIGRLTAEALAATPPVARDANIAKLSLSQSGVRLQWSDTRIANELARTIRQHIDGGL